MKVLDEVWMLVNESAPSVIYCIGTSAKDVWDRVIEGEVMGTGATKEALRKQGYRAKKVAIALR